MKTTITIDIEPSDLREEMQNVIKELTKEEICQMARTFGKKKVNDRINEILDPLVLEVLTDEPFRLNGEYFQQHNKKNIDHRIKETLINYLDTPGYIYNKDSKNISELVSPSSSSTNNPTRIQHFISKMIRDYVDKHLMADIKKQLEEIVDSKEKLEAILNEQLKSLVNSKIK